MKLEDFEIGLAFTICTGQRWRCTDIGTRTILAIELKPDLDEAWLAGPPYVVPEIPFDERDIELAYRDETEAVREAVARADRSVHPGYPHEVVKEMMDTRLSEASRTYPRQRLFRVDRIDPSGEVLHPFAAERDGSEWLIRVYVPFAGTFRSMPECDFIRLPQATEADLKRRG